jgi:hypothetical protein
VPTVTIRQVDFQAGGRRQGTTQADEPSVSQAVSSGPRAVYVYDFGDDWRHDIVVEKITSTSRNRPFSGSA